MRKSSDSHLSLPLSASSRIAPISPLTENNHICFLSTMHIRASSQPRTLSFLVSADSRTKPMRLNVSRGSTSNESCSTRAPPRSRQRKTCETAAKCFCKTSQQQQKQQSSSVTAAPSNAAQHPVMLGAMRAIPVMSSSATPSSSPAHCCCCCGCRAIGCSLNTADSAVTIRCMRFRDTFL